MVSFSNPRIPIKTLVKCDIFHLKLLFEPLIIFHNEIREKPVQAAQKIPGMGFNACKGRF